MKNIIAMLLCLTLLVIPCLAAEEATTENPPVTMEAVTEAPTEAPTQAQTEPATVYMPVEVPAEVPEAEADQSQIRIMVTSYSVSDGFLTPGTEGSVTVKFKNMHKTKTATNMVVSVFEDSDEIRPADMGTKYIESLKAGETYTWTVPLETVHTAQMGEHKLTFNADFESENGGGGSANAVLRVKVRQPAELEYEGALLPVKVVQTETVTLNINLMNTGKSTLYNCKIKCDIEGLKTATSTFVGEIPSGENKVASPNLRVDAEKTGKVEGKITITYEDSFGNEYSFEEEVSTNIEKKVVKADTEEKEKEKSNPLWWLFLVLGLAVGGGTGFGIPQAIRSYRERRHDDETL